MLKVYAEVCNIWHCNPMSSNVPKLLLPFKELLQYLALSTSCT